MYIKGNKINPLVASMRILFSTHGATRSVLEMEKFQVINHTVNIPYQKYTKM
jgi:hypothetical protein